MSREPSHWVGVAEGPEPWLEGPEPWLEGPRGGAGRWDRPPLRYRSCRCCASGGASGNCSGTSSRLRASATRSERVLCW